MLKTELIQEIMKINKWVTHEILEQFTETDLCAYLRQLKNVRKLEQLPVTGASED